MSAPRVFIVDDDYAVRDALSAQLDAAGFTTVTFASAQEFLESCDPAWEGCIILDVNMPGMDGPRLQEALNRRGSQLPIIFLSGQGNIPITVQTIKAGAIDFLTKPVLGSALFERVREAFKRCTRIREQREEFKTIDSRLSTLTVRECEIMRLIISGKTCKEIAQILNISHRTVEVHRAHILQKTGANNVVDLVKLASMSSLVQKTN